MNVFFEKCFQLVVVVREALLCFEGQDSRKQKQRPLIGISSTKTGQIQEFTNMEIGLEIRKTRLVYAPLSK